MSHLEEKLLILKKKKLTAKSIVDQQRHELRLLKSSLSLNDRLEEIYNRFQDKQGVNRQLLQRIVNQSTEISEFDRIHRAIDELSKLINQIQRFLSIETTIDFKDETDTLILQKQKESLKLIQWKLSDICAHRIADEVSCITS